MRFYETGSLLRKTIKASTSECSSLRAKNVFLFQHRNSETVLQQWINQKTLLLVLQNSNLHRTPPEGCHSGFEHFCLKDTNPPPSLFFLMSGMRTRQILSWIILSIITKILKSQPGKRVESGYIYTSLCSTFVYENFNL